MCNEQQESVIGLHKAWEYRNEKGIMMMGRIRQMLDFVKKKKLIESIT